MDKTETGKDIQELMDEVRDLKAQVAKNDEPTNEPTPDTETETDTPQDEVKVEAKTSLSKEQTEELQKVAAANARKVMSEAENAISEGIDAVTAEMKAKNESDKVFGIIGQRDVVQKKARNEHLRLYLKAMATNTNEDVMALKKFVADANAGVRQADVPGGGDLVPEVLRREVAWIEETEGWTFANTTTITVAEGVQKVELPTAQTVAVNWVGAGAGRERTGEAEKITSAKPGLAKVSLDMRKIAAIVPLTTEMLNGSIVDLEALVRALVINRISHAVDAQFQSQLIQQQDDLQGCYHKEQQSM